MKATNTLSYNNLFKWEIMLLLEIFWKLQGIYFLVVVNPGQVTNFKCRGGSRAAATSKMERFVIVALRFITYHKVLHFGCCSSPRSASEIADSISDFKILNFRLKTEKFITTKQNLQNALAFVYLFGLMFFLQYLVVQQGLLDEFDIIRQFDYLIQVYESFWILLFFRI